MPACACISKIFMPTTAIISSRHVSKVWRGLCGKPSRRMSDLMAPRLPPKAVSSRYTGGMDQLFPVPDSERRAALEAAETRALGLFAAIERDGLVPVSYTHLTLP